MAEPIAKCPVCGSEKCEVENASTSAFAHWVRCLNCGNCGKTKMTASAAIKSWNKGEKRD
ncbi:MAG: hypothetical protein IJ747_01545 [Lachnospiraceae bacterium]|nr:hypothetical protein [Lachnospiraceae bacterium]